MTHLSRHVAASLLAAGLMPLAAKRVAADSASWRASPIAAVPRDRRHACAVVRPTEMLRPPKAGRIEVAAAVGTVPGQF